MAPPPADVQRQSQINSGIVGLAAEQTAALWPQIDWDSSAAVRAVRTLYGAIVGQFGRSTAAVAAQLYDEQRSQHALPPYTATLADPLPDVMLDKIVTSAFLGAEPADDAAATSPVVPTVRSGLTFRDLPVEERVPARLDDALQRLVMQPGRNTIAENATRDPGDARYIRVPQGERTCEFCMMLASREINRRFGGYKSKESAGGTDDTKYHKHCDCEAFPIFADTDVSDVSPNIGTYQDLYNKAALAAGPRSSTKEILAKMRQQRNERDRRDAEAAAAP